jgi:hypothetical protein
MKYMTLGYGTAWGGKKPTEAAETTAGQRARARTSSPPAMRYVEPAPDVDLAEEKLKEQIRQENDGYFLVGLKGDMQDIEVDDDNDEGNWNNRIPLRTVHVEMLRADNSSIASSVESDDTPAHEKELSFQSTTTTASGLSRLRPVVYVVRVFG